MGDLRLLIAAPDDLEASEGVLGEGDANQDPGAFEASVMWMSTGRPRISPREKEPPS